MKGFGTDETVLIKILSKPDPLQMALLRNTYSARIHRNLEHDVASETSGHFKEGLVALVRGPLMQDVSSFLFTTFAVPPSTPLAFHSSFSWN
jgi:annexin A7/11